MNGPSPPAEATPSRCRAESEPGLRRKVVIALVMWTVPYACYRAYYAAGGDFGMIGQPVSSTMFRAINAVGAAVIGCARSCRRLRRGYPFFAARCRYSDGSPRWDVACCASVDSSQPVLETPGQRPQQYPLAVSPVSRDRGIVASWTSDWPAA